jgi:hypothetical protein
MKVEATAVAAIGWLKYWIFILLADGRRRTQLSPHTYRKELAEASTTEDSHYLQTLTISCSDLSPGHQFVLCTST